MNAHAGCAPMHMLEFRFALTGGNRPRRSVFRAHARGDRPCPLRIAHKGTTYARFSHLLMKHLLQHISETDEIFGIYTCNMCIDTTTYATFR
jgi:hypothetical protein